MKKYVIGLVVCLFVGAYAFVAAACSLPRSGAAEKNEHTHSWGVERVLAERTCTTEGVRMKICQECGEEEFTVNKATGHDLKELETTEATCTEKGYVTYICNHENCGETFIGAWTDRLPHVYENGVCKDCGAEDEEDLIGGPVNSDGFLDKYY